MESKVLILTDKNSKEENNFVWLHIDVESNYSMKLLSQSITLSKHEYLFCIIEIPATVKKFLKISCFLKRFYSFPIVVFERNIIEKYPSEKNLLKRKIDLLIQKEFSNNDFFCLINYVMGLNVNNEIIENKIELVGIFGNIKVLPQKRRIYVDNVNVQLTKKEFDIFYYLFQKKGAVVTHKELYEKVWKSEYLHDDTNIMAHVHRLRGKVEKDPQKPIFICNQYGIGYYFGGVY